MAYYIRIFCKSTMVPSLHKVIGWIHDSGGTLNHSHDNNSASLDLTDWSQVEFHYRDALRPVIVDLEKDDGTEACLFKREVNDFVDFSLASVPDSPQKSKVITHLRSSKYVVAIDVPTGSFEDQDYYKLGNFINSIAMFCDGMVQADGEGFYEGSKLVIELP